MNFRRSKPLLLTPGPVNLTARTRRALAAPALHHRSAEFQRILHSLQKKLQAFFQTEEPVLILNSSGTGAMEAALVNVSSPGDPALFLCAGKFGFRWRDMGRAHGLAVQSIEAPPGNAVQPEAVARFLHKNPSTSSVFVQAVETSTGAEHDIKTLSKILRDFPALLIVDGIAALGSMNLPMDKQGIDVLIGGSQKSFELPAGLAFIALSKKAWERRARSLCPKYYFDLKREREALDKGQTAFSSNTAFIRALDKSLNPPRRGFFSGDFISEEGGKPTDEGSDRERRIRRSKALARAARAFCRAMNLRLFAQRPAAAVTAFEPPEGVSPARIKEALEKSHGFVLAGGQDDLRGKILRIGSLGPIERGDYLRALKALALELQKAAPDRFPKERVKKALSAAKAALNEK